MKEKNNKLYLTYNDVEGFVATIARKIVLSDWRPDYIVGITRGGLLPANLLSQYLNVPMCSLDVSLRDSSFEATSNLWMAEDAYGYIDSENRKSEEISSNPAKRKNILIVDDINDSGATLAWIYNDWIDGCLPDDDAWDEIFGSNVRVATLVNNEASDYTNIQYTAHTINKAEKDVWVVFPWEEWWKIK